MNSLIFLLFVYSMSCVFLSFYYLYTVGLVYFETPNC